jgi:DNA invertase Pin-like site-specific DNA recombinase
MTRVQRLPVAIYHRVSTVDQNPALAIPTLRHAARVRGWRVVLAVEEARSTRKDRPGLARVLAAAKAREVRAVVVWKLTRFGRSNLELLTNVENLRRWGCSFVAVSDGLEIGPHGTGEDTVSALVLRILAAVAEFERETISENTRLGLADARRRGVHLGPPVLSDAPDGARVAELRADGLSWPEAAQVLHSTAPACRRAFKRFTCQPTTREG